MCRWNNTTTFTSNHYHLSSPTILLITSVYNALLTGMASPLICHAPEDYTDKPTHHCGPVICPNDEALAHTRPNLHAHTRHMAAGAAKICFFPPRSPHTKQKKKLVRKPPHSGATQCKQHPYYSHVYNVRRPQLILLLQMWMHGFHMGILQRAVTNYNGPYTENDYLIRGL